MEVDLKELHRRLVEEVKSSEEALRLLEWLTRPQLYEIARLQGYKLWEVRDLRKADLKRLIASSTAYHREHRMLRGF